MMPEITQENVRIFIPYKVSKVCAQICKDENISVVKAIAKFYRSRVALLLQQEETKLWHDGWTSIYSMYKQELLG